jgi:hypothetical protein
MTLKLHLEDGWLRLLTGWCRLLAAAGMPHKPFVARAAGPSRWRACTASSWNTPLATSPPVVQQSRLALSRRALSGVMGCTSTAFTTCTFTPLSRWLSRVYAARPAAKRGTLCPAETGSHRSMRRAATMHHATRWFSMQASDLRSRHQSDHRKTLRFALHDQLPPWVGGANGTRTPDLLVAKAERRSDRARLWRD